MAQLATKSKPKRAMTDGHASHPRAINEKVRKKVLHRTNSYLMSYTEQNHRPIKQQYDPM